MLRPELNDETCPKHLPIQHRDGKPPWCRTCRLTEEYTIPVSMIKKKKG